jgi:hypothetical protein
MTDHPHDPEMPRSGIELSAAERRDVIHNACLARSEVMSREGHTFSPPLTRGDWVATLVVSALGLVAMYLGYLA